MTNTTFLIELKVIWEKMDAFFSYLIKISLFLLLVILLIYTSYELFRYDLIIKPFEVPLNLSKERGYTGVVVAHRLQYYLDEIREEINRTSMRGAVQRLASAQFNELQKQQSIDIPTVGLSLNTVIQQIRKIMGIKQRHINGDIVVKDNNFYMTLRITGKPTVKIEPHHDIEVVMKNTATQLLKMLEPLIFGLSYYVNNQPHQLESLINEIRQTERFQKTPLSTKEEAIALILEGCLLERQANKTNKQILKQALKKFNQAQQLVSSIRIIFRFKGDTLRALGEFDKAIEAYQTAINFNTKYAGGIYVQWALALLEQKKIQEAFKIYELASKKDSDNPWVYTSWGERLAIELKDFEAAYQKFEMAQEKNPNYALTYAIWGDRLLQEGMILRNENNEQWRKKYQQANKKFKQAITLEPGIAWVYGNWGMVLEELGEYEQAILKYRKALDLGVSWVYSELSQALIKSKKYDESSINEILNSKQNVQSLKLYYELGKTLSAMKRDKEAISRYKKVLELDPKHVWSHIRLGHALILVKQFEPAFTQCEKILTLTTSEIARAAAHALCGLSYLGLNQIEVAIERCQIALRLYQQEDWAYWCLGDALSSQEKFDEAVKQYEQAVKLKPKEVLYHYKWAKTLVQLEQYPAALTQYQKVLALDEDGTFSIRTQTDIEVLKAKMAKYE